LCLRALLNHADFPGRDELTVQAESATVLDADGEAIGVILAFADNGYLSALEIYDWTDPEGISPLPPLERPELRVER
jgi:hypothetical protein